MGTPAARRANFAIFLPLSMFAFDLWLALRAPFPLPMHTQHMRRTFAATSLTLVVNAQEPRITNRAGALALVVFTDESGIALSAMLCAPVVDTEERRLAYYTRKLQDAMGALGFRFLAGGALGALPRFKRRATIVVQPSRCSRRGQARGLFFELMQLFIFHAQRLACGTHRGRHVGRHV